MRQAVRIGGGLGTMLALVALLAAASPPTWADTPPGRSSASDGKGVTGSQFTLRSPDLAPRETVALSHVYDGRGCDGGNVSPALLWNHPPAGTLSFAVLMFDPDAPGGWWHWAVFDIPAGLRSLRAGAGDPARHLLPRGAIQVRNDFGSLGYGGPCPPPGPPHHYRLMLYALRLPSLELGADASAAQVAAAVRAAALAKAQIIAPYGR